MSCEVDVITAVLGGRMGKWWWIRMRLIVMVVRCSRRGRVS